MSKLPYKLGEQVHVLAASDRDPATLPDTVEALVVVRDGRLLEPQNVESGSNKMSGFCSFNECETPSGKWHGRAVVRGLVMCALIVCVCGGGSFESPFQTQFEAAFHAAHTVLVQPVGPISRVVAAAGTATPWGGRAGERGIEAPSQLREACRERSFYLSFTQGCRNAAVQRTLYVHDPPRVG